MHDTIPSNKGLAFAFKVPKPLRVFSQITAYIFGQEFSRQQYKCHAAACNGINRSRSISQQNQAPSNARPCAAGERRGKLSTGANPATNTSRLGPKIRIPSNRNERVRLVRFMVPPF